MHTWHFAAIAHDAEHRRWSCDWTLPADCSFLQGHFPEFPVLPAFAIITISAAFIEQVANASVKERKLSTARHCKFKAPIVPGPLYRLVCAESADHDWLVEWFAPADLQTPLLSLQLG